MIRRILISLCLAMALAVPLAGAVHAQGVGDSIVFQLQEQGYGDIKVRRTLLGRLRITAENATFYREIVVNPATGEILRDYQRPKDGSGVNVWLNDPSQTSASTSGGSGHDDGGSDDPSSDDEPDDGSDPNDD